MASGFVTAKTACDGSNARLGPKGAPEQLGASPSTGRSVIGEVVGVGPQQQHGLNRDRETNQVACA